MKFLSAIFRRSCMEHDMADELRFHIEKRTEDLMRSGSTRAAAERRARVEFGGVESYKESCREARGLALFDRLRGDLRYTLRTLRAAPGFSAIAILSLALGIGANTTVYRVIDEVLLHDVTADRPDRLLRIGDHGISYPNYQDFARSGVFQSLAVFGLADANWRQANSTEGVFLMKTSPNFFETLGVEPRLGRRYTDADADSLPAIVSDGFWRRRLGADPNVLGRALDLDDHRYTIIGVMAPEYRSAMGLAIMPEVHVAVNPASVAGLMLRDSMQFLNMIGRMPDGETREQVRAALEAQRNRLQHDYPATAKALENITHLEAIGGIGRLRDDPTDGTKFLTFYALLALMVGLVLVIACANVSGLLMARGAARQREIAVRSALGAGRARLIGQFLAEGLVLSVSGAALGLLLNFWLTHVLSQIRVPLSAVSFEFSFAPDRRLVWYTLAITAITAPLCALAPAIRASRTDLASVLRRQRGGTGSPTMRNLLVVGQVALSFVLMAAAILFARATVTLASVNPGFDLGHTIKAEVTPMEGRYRGEQLEAYRQRLLERVRSISGVVSAASAGFAPLNPETPTMMVRAAGQPVSEARRVNLQPVGPDYFETMDIRLRGREFDVRDRGRMPVPVIVNLTLARELFPAGDALGQQLVYARRNRDEVQVEIVGVAADSKIRSLGEASAPLIYQPDFSTRLMVRVAGPPDAFVSAVSSAVRDVDPSAAVEAETMRDYSAISMWPARIGRQFLMALSVLGLALALVGLYGVIAFVVARRIGEIGVRMALGASRAGVAWMVLRDGARVIGAGMAIGVGLAILAMKPLGVILPATLSTRDPIAFAGAALVILAAGAAAVLVPARRASKIDPAIALRYE
jgi:putative ABC transport system permease protein